LRSSFFIQRFEGAVNPTEAQRFFHCVVVSDTGLACVFFVIDQPNIFFRLVMFF
jgi:hypothetical protein